MPLVGPFPVGCLALVDRCLLHLVLSIPHENVKVKRQILAELRLSVSLCFECFDALFSSQCNNGMSSGECNNLSDMKDVISKYNKQPVLRPTFTNCMSINFALETLG